MTVEVASKNAHKLRELAVLLPGWELHPTSAARLPDETGATFYENAAAKARFGLRAAAPGRWAVGEDSGLEVDALGGRPGIRSARFAGEEATDEENVALLLAELEGVPAARRGARYVCELVCLSPAGAEHRGRGTLEGRIAGERRGSAGFGYDPVFVPAGEERTVAELGDAWKARHSHRAAAASALVRAVGNTASAR